MVEQLPVSQLAMAAARTQSSLHADVIRAHISDFAGDFLNHLRAVRSEAISSRAREVAEDFGALHAAWCTAQRAGGKDFVLFREYDIGHQQGEGTVAQQMQQTVRELLASAGLPEVHVSWFRTVMYIFAIDGEGLVADIRDRQSRILEPAVEAYVLSAEYCVDYSATVLVPLERAAHVCSALLEGAGLEFYRVTTTLQPPGRAAVVVTSVAVSRLVRDFAASRDTEIQGNKVYVRKEYRIPAHGVADVIRQQLDSIGLGDAHVTMSLAGTTPGFSYRGGPRVIGGDLVVIDLVDASHLVRHFMQECVERAQCFASSHEREYELPPRSRLDDAVHKQADEVIRRTKSHLARAGAGAVSVYMKPFNCCIAVRCEWA
eukprot:TRINITY_DN51175_c0_g1_i1.p1 TRINITY_DN51175_c0_g1~~TRINITY_DN51175_c0_g1_i1.p1  ORF type:complete len:374 (+),score=96.48 TRINITY_DN51175_c0_g1_i1:74-1195(+)